MDQIHSHKTTNRQFIPLIFVGIGLIFLGFAVIKLIGNGEVTANPSVIPSKVNFPAPDITLNDLHGNKVTIADFQQHIVMINNWATWCPPCNAEMPTLLKYYQEHADHGFILFGIEAGDPAEQVTQFVDKYQLTFPILLDPNNRSLSAFQTDSLPSSFVIDHNGTVILAWTGPISRDMLEKYVTPLLEQ